MPKTQEVASALLAALEEAHPTGPFAVGGIGYGAILGYELARKVCILSKHIYHLCVFHFHVNLGYEIARKVYLLCGHIYDLSSISMCCLIHVHDQCEFVSKSLC